MTRFTGVGLILIVLLLAGLLGWVRSYTPETELNANQANWHAPTQPNMGHEKIAAIRKKLLDTSYFQDVEMANRKDQGEGPPPDSALAIAEKEYGDFPHIISISRIDGQDTAQLRIGESGVQTVHANDTLESGWIIKEINSDHLVAMAGSERFSFAVFEHNNGQGKNDADQ